MAPYAGILGGEKLVLLMVGDIASQERSGGYAYERAMAEPMASKWLLSC
jgi:hypothetical protein